MENSNENFNFCKKIKRLFLLFRKKTTALLTKKLELRVGAFSVFSLTVPALRFFTRYN